MLAAELSRSAWLDFGAFRWHDLTPGRAARATFGVITPLVIGEATGHIEFGSFAALGALPAGFVSFRGLTWSRLVAVVLAAMGMALSTFVGAVAEASHPLLLVPVIFCWAYIAGLVAALGPTALVVSLQWPVALLVGSALPLGPGPAGTRALLVLAGGLWQAALVATSWTVGRGSEERTAVAESLLELARYAADLAAGSHEPPAPAFLPGRIALNDPNPLMRSAARQWLIDLNQEAERLRASLTALGIHRDTDHSGLASMRLLAAASSVLTEIAAALTSRPADRAAHLARATTILAAAVADPGNSELWAAQALLGQLRALMRMTERLNLAEPARTDRPPPAWVRRATLRDMALTLHASFSLSSETGRHALRLAVTTALAEVVVRAIGLSHGYWGVLTIFIVLRPDYSSTLYRGLQRAAGTIVGAGLGILTVLLMHFGMAVLVAGIAVSLVAAYSVFTVNYLLYALFLTDFVVVLLALLGLPAGPTALARLAGTGVGLGLALLAYVLWPTWEGTSAAEKLATLFASQGQYTSALLRAYTRPDDGGTAKRSEMQRAVRRARIDAIASADRLAGEPDHPPMTAALARSLASAGHRISQASLGLTAALGVHRQASSALPDAALQPRLDELADDVATATGQLAATLRAMAHPRGGADVGPLAHFPPLRREQQAIWQDSDGGQAAARPDPTVIADPVALASDDATGLYVATDSLVDAINTAADILRRDGRSA